MNLEQKIENIIGRMQVLIPLLEKYEARVDSHSVDLASLRSELRLSREITSKELQEFKRDLINMKEECKVCRVEMQKEKIEDLKEEKDKGDGKRFRISTIIFTAVIGMFASLLTWLAINFFFGKWMTIFSSGPSVVHP